MKLYVGNLSFDSTETDLQDLFEKFGTVSETHVISDRETGRSRGFGFVTMSSNSEGQAAIAALHGKQIGGRTLTVNEARPKEDRPRGGGGRGSFSGSRR
jgi:cold-inducible RNA-binding protein